MADWWDGIIPQTKPRTNEKLWEVWARHSLYTCELKYRGEYGVEAQIFKNAELLVGYRHQTRELAVLAGCTQMSTRRYVHPPYERQHAAAVSRSRRPLRMMVFE